jgi:hypothetical protein
MKNGTVGAPWCDTLLLRNEVFTKCALFLYVGLHNFKFNDEQ